ncbi:MAG: hypothetical protein DMF69_01110 [Acidobacteria bacterium]|nr:MAG: hypothetical protein DMF69_01110 [Acidobacteriota bacterium]
METARLNREITPGNICTRNWPLHLGVVLLSVDQMGLTTGGCDHSQSSSGIRKGFKEMKCITLKLLAASLILLSLSLQPVVAQAPSKAADLIALKAQDFKLGSPRPESPAPRQTPPPRNQGWWQAFERGWVYWTPGHGAHVVRGRIFEAWGREGWEQGTLAFPINDEEACRAPDSRDLFQRFEGGVIYWRASTNEATFHYNDAQNGLTFAVNGVCTPTAVAAPNTATTAPISTNRVEPNISVPAEGPPLPPDKKPAPVERSRGLFRITIDNFIVEHVVHDGALDAGDDAFVMWDAQEFNSDGRLVGGPRSGQSPIYGDMGRNRAQIQAGTQGENGGLRAGDKITGRSAPSANRLPMLVGDFELVDGENAFVFAPTMWVAEDNVGENARLYRQRFQSRTRFAAYDVRHFLEEPFSARFHWLYGTSRGGDDWFDMRFYAGPTIREDRPIGSYQAYSTVANIWYTRTLDFIPHTFLLTYKYVTDFMQSAGGRREVPFEVRYTGASYSGMGGGSYTINMTIERVK